MYIFPLVYKSNVQKSWTPGKFFEMWIEWRTGSNKFEQADWNQFEKIQKKHGRNRKNALDVETK